MSRILPTYLGAGLLCMMSLNTFAEDRPREFLVVIDYGHALSIGLDGKIRSLVVEPGKDMGSGLVGHRTLIPSGGQHAVSARGELVILNSKACVVYRHSLFTTMTVAIGELTSVRAPGLASLHCRNPEFSPDHRHLAVASSESLEQPGQLAVLDLDSGFVKALTSFAAAEDGGVGRVEHRPAWSPDGQKIAFYYAPDSIASDPINHQEYELYVVDSNGTMLKLAAKCRRPGTASFMPWVGPLWSSDGSLVYFVGNYESDSNQEGPGEPLTYSVPVAGGPLKLVCHGNPTSITPDGRYLFATGRPPTYGPRSHRVRVDLRSGEQVELGADWNEALVSRTGKFTVGAPKPDELVFFSIDGQELRRVYLADTPLARGISLTRSAYWVQDDK